jgi:hypothetical protein
MSLVEDLNKDDTMTSNANLGLTLCSSQNEGGLSSRISDLSSTSIPDEHNDLGGARNLLN